MATVPQSAAPTSSRESVAARVLGGLGLLLSIIVLILGLGVTGPDYLQKEYVRIIYIHPAVAWVSYVAFAVCAFAGLMWLRPKSRSLFWDQIAGSAAEIGCVFTFLALVTGSIWGRGSWAVWWTWDARTTSTLLLLFLYLGVVALRQVPQDRAVRARQTAIASLLAVVNIPLVHFSVNWWRTQHQGESLAKNKLHGLQLVTMLLAILAFTLVFFWLLILRYRVARWEDQLEDTGLDSAIDARRAESGRITPAASPSVPNSSTAASASAPPAGSTV